MNIPLSTTLFPLNVCKTVSGCQPPCSYSDLGCVLRVIDYYAKKSIVANLPAEKPPKEVTTEVQKVLLS
ncbi:hypothetical protein C3L33_00553, partial [Rhododendron williamsianum]